MSDFTEGFGNGAFSQSNEEEDWHGKTVGQFRLLDKLGEGGQGSVYRAEHIHLHDHVAVKLLHLEAGSNPTLLERFRREAKTTAKLRHENIVDISDFGQLHDGGFYMAMELLTGVSLQDCIDDKEHFSIPDLLEIFAQLCAALGHTHRQGIYHRDLKPDNIFLIRETGRHNHVKVIDFGIAAVKETNVQLTRSNAFIGTPTYMSPEQAQGKVKEFDGRSDLYTIALILFELLTERQVFVGKSFLDLAFQHASMAPPTLASIVPGRVWAPSLESFFVTALAKPRAERPADAAAFWQLCEDGLLAQHRCDQEVLSRAVKPKYDQTIQDSPEVSALPTPSMRDELMSSDGDGTSTEAMAVPDFSKFHVSNQGDASGDAMVSPVDDALEGARPVVSSLDDAATSLSFGAHPAPAAQATRQTPMWGALIVVLVLAGAGVVGWWLWG